MKLPPFYLLDAVTDPDGHPLRGYQSLLGAPVFLFTPPRTGRSLPLAVFAREHGRLTLYRARSTPFLCEREPGCFLTEKEQFILQPTSRLPHWVPVDWLMLSLDLAHPFPIRAARFGQAAVHPEQTAPGRYTLLHPRTGRPLLELQCGPDWICYTRRQRDLILFLFNRGTGRFLVLNGYCVWQDASLESGTSLCCHIP